MIKIKWQDKCKRAQEFHRSQIKLIQGHNISETAKQLGYSIGATSEFLQLAEWMNRDPKVEKFKVMADALDYIKKEKLKIKFGE